MAATGNRKTHHDSIRDKPTGSEDLPGIKMTSRGMLSSSVTAFPVKSSTSIHQWVKELVRQFNEKQVDGIRTFHPRCVAILECRFFDAPDAARQRA